MLSFATGTAYAVDAVPSITLISPINGATVTSSHPTFVFQANGVASPAVCNLIVYAPNNPSVFYSQVYNGNVDSPVSLTSTTSFPDATGYSWYAQCNNVVLSDTTAFNVAADNTAPAIAKILPPPYTNIALQPFSWSVTDSGSTASGTPVICKLFVDSLQVGSDISQTVPSTFNIAPSAPFSAAMHNYQITCTDASGNARTLSNHFTLDTTAPVVSLSGAPAAWTTTPATVRVECIDGDNPNTQSCGPNTWAFWNLVSQLPPTYHTMTYASNPGTCSNVPADYTGPAQFTASSHIWVCAYATDVAGNGAFSAPVEILVGSATSVCGNGIVEAGEECDGGACCNADTCTLKSTTTVCRPSAGPCDIADVCNGISANCPADNFQSSDTLCATASCSGSTATSASMCTGESAACPAGATVACNPYVCGENACKTSCASSADCASGMVCSNNVCTASTIVCQTGADTNGDGKIDMNELLAYIGQWNIGAVSMNDLLAAIGFWNAGIGC